ncbi:MAG: hypothetical protein WC423_14275 [Vulcanimicrobiota bacterium]
MLHCSMGELKGTFTAVFEALSMEQQEQPATLEVLNDEAEKKKDYRRAVMVQILFLALILLADEGLKLVGIGLRGFVFDALFHAVGAWYLVLLCDMLRNYTRARWLVRGGFVALGIAFLILVCVNLLFVFSNPVRDQLRLVAYGMLALVQLVVIAFAIRDLFRGRHRATDRLWGSACIYFMSGFAFSTAFSTILMVDPAAFGSPLPPDAYVFFETTYLSFNALVGLDTSYPDATRLVRNLALLEGLWSQLYLVLLIGRLLTPTEK